MKNRVKKSWLQSSKIWLIALAAAALFFAASCDSEGGGSPDDRITGGKIPEGYNPNFGRVLNEIAETIPDDVVFEDLAFDDSAKAKIFPVVKLLGEKHDEMDDKILEKMMERAERQAERAGETIYFSYDSEIENDKLLFESAKLVNRGVSEISGKVSGSATSTASSEIEDYSSIDLVYSYDSDLDKDGDTARILAPGEFIKGKIWVKGSSVDRESGRTESEEEKMAISFAIVFKRDGYSGKVAAELGYAYKEVNDRYEEKKAEARFTIFDDSGKSLGSYAITREADLKKIFRLWDD